MPHRIFKKIYRIVTFLLVLVSGGVSYAKINCNIPNDAAPTLDQIVCPLARVINVFIFAVGSILVVMIVMGAIKMATALGDPKGMKGAWITWQFAAVGGAIVVGVFAILFIITRLFHINFAPMGLTNYLAEQIQMLMVSIGIRGTWKP